MPRPRISLRPVGSLYSGTGRPGSGARFYRPWRLYAEFYLGYARRNQSDHSDSSQSPWSGAIGDSSATAASNEKGKGFVMVPAAAICATLFPLTNTGKT